MKSKMQRKVNVTFQMTEQDKEQVEGVAWAMNMRRMKQGAVVPEISGALALMILFALANLTQFREWVAKGQPK